MRLRLPATIMIGALLALAATPATTAGPAAAVSTGASKWIVAYDGGLPAGILDDLVALGVERAIELPSIDAVAVTAPAAVVRVLALDPRVRAVQPQRRITLDLYASVEQINARGVDEPATYSTTSGNTTETFERPGVDGTGVTVAVIDSGVFAAHPDLVGRVTTGVNTEFSTLQADGGVSYEDWDLWAESTGPLALVDEVGHGTHVAGTIGGDGTAAISHEPMSGVAPAVEIVSIKIASAFNGVVEDVGFEENALAAMDYVVRHGEELGITVVNNSWSLLPYEPGANGVEGFPTDYDAAGEMARTVVDAGITMIFSAGNDGPDPETLRPSPNGIDEVITVASACKMVDGSCDPGEVNDFSSRGAADGSGPQVDVTAPGDIILAAASPSILIPLSRCRDAMDPAYICLSGTSMSSPHVTGAVALMQQVSPGITPAQVEQCLTDTAADMLEPGFDTASGFGLVDTAEALICAHQLTDPAGESITVIGEVEPDLTTPRGSPLPTTGGGAALVALALLLGGSRLRRRRA